MSDDDPKFMKPGDDPQLDRALNELRFDSGLYEAGEYDMFGRRRATGNKGPDGGAAEEGAPSPPAGEAAEAPVEKPAPRAPAPPPPRPARWRRPRWWEVVGGVCAAILPVIVFAKVWKPVTPPAAGTATAGPSATEAPLGTALPRQVEPAPKTTQDPVAAPVGTGAAAPSAVPSAAPAPAVVPKRPKGKPPADDPYDGSAPLSPVTAAPSTPAPPPASAPTAMPARPAPIPTAGRILGGEE
jgi:hypothetical protein